MTRQSVGVALRGAGGFVASRPDWFLSRLSSTNMTNLRALVTMGLAIWTAWRYFAQPKWGLWEPSLEWLGFLVALGGLDVAQYSAKRLTWRRDAPLPPENPSSEVPDA